MTAPSKSIRVGTRGSTLARRQTDEVIQRLSAHRPDFSFDIEIISTAGDRSIDVPLPEIGGKGLFTEEIERAILSGRIDFAVHSLKDLPVENREGLAIGAVPPRATVKDVLVSRNGLRLAELPRGARVGTSSLRRAAQLLRARQDVVPVSIRGSVETRLRKALDPYGEYDAIVLAKAGLERLNRLDEVTEFLPLATMLPAAGQGALAVQCRDERASLDTLQPINDRETELATTAERGFLAGLGGGCSTPVGAFGEWHGDRLALSGRVVSLDGSCTVDVFSEERCADRIAAVELGTALAREALQRGAAGLIGSLT